MATCDFTFNLRSIFSSLPPHLHAALIGSEAGSAVGADLGGANWKRSIVDSLRAYDVLLIKASTSAGKTRFVPQHCFSFAQEQGYNQSVALISPNNASLLSIRDIIYTDGFGVAVHVGTSKVGDNRPAKHQRRNWENIDLIQGQLFRNWMRCQGFNWTTNQYAVIIFDEASALSEPVQLILINIRDHFAKLKRDGRPLPFKVVMMSSALSSYWDDFWKPCSSDKIEVYGRLNSLAHVRLYSKNEFDCAQIASDLLRVLHLCPCRTLSFMPGDNEISAVQSHLAKIEVPSLRLTGGEVEASSNLKRPDENVAFVGTDWVAFGPTLPGLSHVIVSGIVNRRTGRGIEKCIVNQGESLNMAGRGARTCASVVWYLLPVKVESVPWPLAVSFPHPLCVVIGTNARLLLAHNCVEHLQGLGFPNVCVCVVPDRVDVLREAEVAGVTGQVRLHFRLNMLSWHLVVLPALLDTGATDILVFEDSVRMCTDFSNVLRKTHETPVNFAYAAEPKRNESGSISQWFGIKGMRLSRQDCLQWHQAMASLPISKYEHVDIWMQKHGLRAFEPLGGCMPRITGSFHEGMSFAPGWTPNPEFPDGALQLPDFLVDWFHSIPANTRRGQKLEVPPYNASSQGGSLPYGLWRMNCSDSKQAQPATAVSQDMSLLLQRERQGGPAVFSPIVAIIAMIRGEKRWPCQRSGYVEQVLVDMALDGIQTPENVLAANKQLLTPVHPPDLLHAYFSLPTLSKLSWNDANNLVTHHVFDDVGALLFLHEQAASQGYGSLESCRRLVSHVHDFEKQYNICPADKKTIDVLRKEFQRIVERDDRCQAMLSEWISVDRRRFARMSDGVAVVQGEACTPSGSNSSGFACARNSNPWSMSKCVVLDTHDRRADDFPDGTFAVVGDSTFRGLELAASAFIEFHRRYSCTRFIAISGGTALSIAQAVSRLMERLTVLILVVNGNDILLNTPQDALHLDIGMLCALARSKAERAMVLCAGDWSMDRAPRGYNEKAAAMISAFELGGLTVNTMVETAAYPRPDGMHWSPNACLSASKFLCQVLDQAPKLEPLREPVVMFGDRIWPITLGPVALRRHEDKFFPVCVCCVNPAGNPTRITAAHIGKCPLFREKTVASNAYDHLWGMPLLGIAEEHISIQSYQVVQKRMHGSVGGLLRVDPMGVGANDAAVIQGGEAYTRALQDLEATSKKLKAQSVSPIGEYTRALQDVESTMRSQSVKVSDPDQVAHDADLAQLSQNWYDYDDQGAVDRGFEVFLNRMQFRKRGSYQGSANSVPLEQRLLAAMEGEPNAANAFPVGCPQFSQLFMDESCMLLRCLHAELPLSSITRHDKRSQNSHHFAHSYGSTLCKRIDAAGATKILKGHPHMDYQKAKGVFVEFLCARMSHPNSSFGWQGFPLYSREDASQIAVSTWSKFLLCMHLYSN